MADTTLTTPPNVATDEDFSLRPKTLTDYIGQEKAKGNLEIFIQAAKKKRRISGSHPVAWATWPWENDAF